MAVFHIGEHLLLFMLVGSRGKLEHHREQNSH